MKRPWLWKNAKWAAGYMRRVQDPERLAQAAVESPHIEVCKAAVNRLADQNLLAYVAQNTHEPEIVAAVFSKLTGQAQIARVVFSVPKLDTMMPAGFAPELLDRVEDPKILEAVATASPSVSLRGEAVNRVQNKEILRRVAKGDPAAAVRRAAAHRLASLQ